DRNEPGSAALAVRGRRTLAPPFYAEPDPTLGRAATTRGSAMEQKVIQVPPTPPTEPDAPPPPARRRRNWLIAAVVAVVAAGIGVWVAATRPAGPPDARSIGLP